MKNSITNTVATDVEAVHRLQGMITYLAKFLHQLSSVMEPIRRLTRQDCEWVEEQETSMAELKKLVMSVPLLAYCDPSKELVIQCDASSTGLDSTLMQEGKPLRVTPVVHSPLLNLDTRK